MRELKSRNIWSAVAAFFLLTAVIANAAEVAIRAIITNPAQYDNQSVTLQGTAMGVKETRSRAGNDYTTFKLQDPSGNGAVGIFAWGHPALKNGDHVEVTGVFQRERYEGRYTFYNEVEAQSVEPVR